MRLICPKCSIAYRIPDAAIPAEGREVQCSACTHSWYQLPPAATDAGKMASPPEDEPSNAPARPEPDDLPRRKLDPKVLAVLKAEAEREAEARRRDADSVPPDAAAGRPAPPHQPAESIRDRLARLKAAEADAAEEEQWPTGEDGLPAPDHPRPRETPKGKPRTVIVGHAAALSPQDNDFRRTEFSAGTGRAVARPQAAGLPVAVTPKELAIIAERRHRAGFRLGFAVTVGLCCAAVALFVFAPELIQRLPGSQPLIEPVIAAGEAMQSRIASTVRASLQTLSARGG